MTTHISRDSFPVLTEEERNLIGKLWRETPGLSLRERYVSVYWEMFPQLARRLGVSIDQQTAYLDQITYAVIGEAIEDDLLRDSSLELLTKAVYYEAGASEALRERGRFCFCPDRVRYSFRPHTHHASACDSLWQAFCHAAFDLLDYPRSLLVYGKPYLFLDLNMPGSEPCEMEETVALQQTLADTLNLDVRAVQQSWLSPRKFEHVLPDNEIAVAQLAQRVIERIETLLLERGSTLHTQALIPVVEDESVTSMLAQCLSLLQQRLTPIPFWLGVRWEWDQGPRWHVLDPVYGQRESMIHDLPEAGGTRVTSSS